MQIKSSETPETWIVAKTSFTTWGLIGFAAILLIITVACGQRRQADTKPVDSAPATNAYPYFVFAKIMDPIMPIERGDKYEDPLFATLEERGLGEVTGGGTQMDKNNQIEWIGLDLELANLDDAVEVVRQRLRELGAPAGSVLEFKRDDQNVTVPVH